MRQAIVAGQFYPAGKNELERQVRKFLSEKKRENVKACIVPHAGYAFSGMLAGKVISLIPDKKDFIILAVNHSGLGEKISFSLEDFETPLGKIKNNRALGEKILGKLKKEKLEAEINEKAHQYEHSVEVQLPFLQLSQKKFEIVPILLRDLSYDECKKIASVLAEFVSDNIYIIVSGDFTHYGRSYGFVPFTENIKENLYKLDNEVIFEILSLNSKLVYDKAKKTTICGIYGFTILTEVAKIKKWKGKSVGYYASGDVVNQWDNVVGYGGIVFS